MNVKKMNKQENYFFVKYFLVQILVTVAIIQL